LKKSNFKKKIFRFIKRLLIFFFVSTILVAILYRFVPPPITPLMIIRAGEQIANGETVKLQKDWVSYDNLSNNLVRAAVASEDNNFVDHYGFDFEAIRKAQRLNEHSKKLRGASTISQQTAKNVFLWPDRTWVRKGLEVYFTALIEVCWGKKRIMEVYLNVIEMGDGIYGAEKASQIYFHKPAKDLTRSEAAMLAAILPSPLRWSPVNPPAFLVHKQRDIVWTMQRMGPVNIE